MLPSGNIMRKHGSYFLLNSKAEVTVFFPKLLLGSLGIITLGGLSVRNLGENL